MAQTNPNRPTNDKERPGQTAVGVYDVDIEPAGVSTAGETRRVIEPIPGQDVYPEAATRPHSDAISRSVSDPVQRKSPVVTWLIVTFVILLIFWLVYAYLL
jgi:hypothetical protein